MSHSPLLCIIEPFCCLDLDVAWEQFSFVFDENQESGGTVK